MGERDFSVDISRLESRIDGLGNQIINLLTQQFSPIATDLSAVKFEVEALSEVVRRGPDSLVERMVKVEASASASKLWIDEQKKEDRTRKTSRTTWVIAWIGWAVLILVEILKVVK